MSLSTAPGAPIPGIHLRVGDVLAGKYRLDGLVGEGGTGIVVRATHLSLERRVAIKFLRTALASEEIRLRFDREARAIESIESEHVVVVLDFGFLADDLPNMVMEFLEGRDLARVLREDGPLTVEEAVGCMLQVCEALTAAHALGIVHRDLKPANLFLTRDTDGVPHVKVVDFGISKISDAFLLAPQRGGPRPEVTAAHAILGSPRYMAPEQIRSSKHVDARADLWSVGAVLFQLVTGKHAFEAETNVAATVKVLASEPEGLCALAPHAPAELEAVVRRCFAKDVAARWQSALELAEALRPFASDQVLSSIDRLRAARGDPTVDLVELDLAPRSSAPRPVAVPPAPSSLRHAPPPPAAPPAAPPPPSFHAGFVATPAPVSVPVQGPPSPAATRRLLVLALLATFFATLAAVAGWTARRRSAAPRRDAVLDAPARRP